MFSLSALTYHHFVRGGVGDGSGLLQGMVVGIYQGIGFVSATITFLLVLSWATIWFVRGALDQPLARLGRILLLTLSLAVLTSLSGAGVPPPGGTLGAWLASGLADLLGNVFSLLLVTALTLTALLLATDFFFYAYFQADAVVPRAGAGRPESRGAEAPAPAPLASVAWQGEPQVEGRALLHLDPPADPRIVGVSGVLGAAGPSAPVEDGVAGAPGSELEFEDRQPEPVAAEETQPSGPEQADRPWRRTRVRLRLDDVPEDLPPLEVADVAGPATSERAPEPGSAAEPEPAVQPLSEAAGSAAAWAAPSPAPVAEEPASAAAASAAAEEGERMVEALDRSSPDEDASEEAHEPGEEEDALEDEPARAAEAERDEEEWVAPARVFAPVAIVGVEEPAPAPHAQPPAEPAPESGAGAAPGAGSEPAAGVAAPSEAPQEPVQDEASYAAAAHEDLELEAATAAAELYVRAESGTGEPDPLEGGEEPAAGSASPAQAADEPEFVLPRPDAPPVAGDTVKVRQGTLFPGASEDQRLVEEAARLVREARRANVSLLQRRLRVRYDEAVELLHALGRLGVIELLPGETQGRVRVGSDESEAQPDDAHS
ncbi:MAG: DNA translocase FtsK 4TM domain-containing protein [Planctomycetes bacterium]|nr:DNA translocase FtsK 4TM domain-containing protein [Planctomycetota bacterium]